MIELSHNHVHLALHLETRRWSAGYDWYSIPDRAAARLLGRLFLEARALDPFAPRAASFHGSGYGVDTVATLPVWRLSFYGSFGAKHDEGIYSEDDLTNDMRLIGRSAWNTEWMMIIPGGTLLFDPNQGLEKFISTVSDIKVYFQTYSYAGN